MVRLSPKLLHVPKHKRDRMIGAALVDTLREQYGIRSARIVKGDSVRIVRGEYKGVEGKVEEVITESGSLLIEGVQREKIRGGNVRVPIHSSKVTLINLNLDDKMRSARLRGAEKPSEENREARQSEPKNDKKQEKEDME